MSDEPERTTTSKTLKQWFEDRDAVRAAAAQAETDARQRIAGWLEKEKQLASRNSGLIVEYFTTLQGAKTDQQPMARDEVVSKLAATRELLLIEWTGMAMSDWAKDRAKQ